MSTDNSQFDYQNQYPQSGQPFPAAQQQPAPKKKKKWPWVVGAIVVLGIFGSLSGGGDEDTKDVASTPSSDQSLTSVEQETVAEEAAVAVAETEVEEAVISESEAAQTVLALGETGETNDMQIGVNNARFASDYFSNYLCADVTLSNVGDSAKSFSQFDFELETPNGVVADTTITGLDIKNLENAQLNPGGATDGTVCFDSEQQSGDYKVSYTGGFFSTPAVWAFSL
ncbi:DUF4352 domain-containing protein [Corynebacterium callunae]|uniref:DUF4352 domain-containing protein n=1 Tax=Corynebacterium callunae TaxID=1721 RepID=UPI001FFF88CD|nr:DUF4352 domain-containing protein [Corynebacterium callunae]MCK2199753.1 DUF4352 domain-containing protein [Corynebacterium callunae]